MASKVKLSANLLLSEEFVVLGVSTSFDISTDELPPNREQVMRTQIIMRSRARLSSNPSHSLFKNELNTDFLVVDDISSFFCLIIAPTNSAAAP